MDILALLKTKGFTRSFNVETRRSIADLFKKNDRCGIYVLHFSDDVYYVGQAVDVVRRFVQHKKTYDDIVMLYFKDVSRTNLDEVEVEILGTVESSFRVRIINLASAPQCESELDDVVSEHEQEKWLNDSCHSIDTSKRFVDDILRSKYTRAFNKMIRDSKFENLFLPVLRKYIGKCVIEPYRTEVSFWGCSCLLRYSSKTNTVYSRVNLFWQEVFTLAYLHDDNCPIYSFHVSRSILDKTTDAEVKRRYGKFKTLFADDHYYQKGGQDQFCVSLYDRDEALKILDDELFVRSAKLFNLRNMKKGAHVYARYHCMDLADLILPM